MAYARPRSFDLLVCLCAGLFAMAPASASKIDSFDAPDDLLRTLPRTIPGTDFTQIQTGFASVIADRTITLTAGSALLTGTTLHLSGGSSATINYDLSAPVDLTSSGANAFYMDFSLSDSTAVNIVLSVGDADDFYYSYEPQYFPGPDGAYRASFPFNEQLLNQLNITAAARFYLELITTGGQNTFSLDELGTTVIPIPAAVWFFASALGLLGWIRREPMR